MGVEPVGPDDRPGDDVALVGVAPEELGHLVARLEVVGLGRVEPDPGRAAAPVVLLVVVVVVLGPAVDEEPLERKIGGDARRADRAAGDEERGRGQDGRGPGRREEAPGVGAAVAVWGVGRGRLRLFECSQCGTAAWVL